MIKSKVMSATLSVVGIIMITIAVVLQSEDSNKLEVVKDNKNKVNVVNMASSNRVVQTTEVEKTNNTNISTQVEEVSLEEAPQADYIPPRVEVYNGMTMEELAAKLDRN